MAFSMSRAWSDSFGLVRDRWPALVAITIGMLVVGLIATLPFLPLWLELLRPAADPEVQAQRIMELWPQVMGVSLLANAIQLIGYCALVAVLGPDRPAIGPALLRGLKAMPATFVAALFVVVGLYAAMIAVLLVAVLVIGLLVGATSLQGGAPAAMAGPLVLVLGLLYLGALVGVLYLAFRFVVLLPIVMFERAYNPFTAVARAWTLTRRDSWKILGFWVLILAVISIVFGAVLLSVAGSIIRLDGPPPTLESLMPLWLVMIPLNAALVPVLTAMVVATYRQLAPSDEGDEGDELPAV